VSPPQLEAPLFSLLPGVRVAVGLDNVEGGECDIGDDNTEDKDEGSGGNGIDVLEGPTLQLLACQKLLYTVVSQTRDDTLFEPLPIITPKAKYAVSNP